MKVDEEKIRQFLKDKKVIVNDFLSHFIDNCLSQEMKNGTECLDAIKHAILNGGKRLRPILTIVSFETFSGQPVKDFKHPIMPIAAAIELVHNYSLVHDDLPALDDSDQRRGQITLHRKYGDAMAVLVGDGYLTEAFGLMAGSSLNSAEVIIELVKAAGFNGLVGGQVRDIYFDHQQQDSRAHLEFTYRLKTMALFKAAVLCGALAAGIEKQSLESLQDYSEKLGMLFQITDDLLDLEEDMKASGAEAKLTYPIMEGVEEARRKIDRLYQGSIASLASIPVSSQNLQDITYLIYSRTN